MKLTALELAHKYLEFVYESGDLVELRKILTKDLEFRGTYFDYDSADEYIAAFEGENFKSFSYQILYSFEKDSTSCIIYDLIKPSGPIRISQTFEVSSQKISKILLIFDGREFSDDSEDEDEWNL